MGLPLSASALPHRDRTDPRSLPGAVLDVWLLDLLALEKDADQYRQLLNQQERQREERYRAPHARRDFLLTRGRLRQLLGAYLDMPPSRVSLVTNEHGKPRLEGTEENSGLVFSITHSGDLAVLAFARDTALGVDTEIIRARRDLEGLAEQCLSQDEWKRWHDCPQDQQPAEFIRHWVCKEAFVKATGRGLALGVDKVGVRADFSGFEEVPAPFRPVDRWHLFHWEVGAYRFALAYSGIPREIRFRI